MTDADLYHPADKRTKEDLARTMNLTNLMFGLIKLFSSISQDPLLDTFPEGQELLEDYRQFCIALREDVIYRLMLRKIRDKIPYIEAGRPNVTFNRIRAGEFKTKNRYELSYENVTMFT